MNNIKKFLRSLKHMSKKGKIILISSVCVFLIIVGVILFLVLNKDSKPKELGDFSIKSFNQDLTDANNINKLEFEKSSNASNYIVYIYNAQDKLLKEIKTKETKIFINDLTIEYNDDITFKVVAFDNNGNKKRSSNELDVTWSLPSFQVSEITDTSIDEDLVVRINIDEEDMSNYHLVLSKEDEEIVKLEIDNVKMIIPNSYFKDNLGKYKVSLYLDDILINFYEFSVGLPEIGEISIDSIRHNSVVEWDDFEIAFSGGENANLYEISIFKDDKMIFFKQLPEMTYTMDITQLEENTTYVLKVMAYNRIDTSINNQRVLSFKTGSKQKALNVDASYDNGNVYIGKTIELTTDTKTATIYYTIDGSTPSVNSLKYVEPIEVKSDLNIKAIAIANNYYDSDITEFNYKAIVKPKMVYLSPYLDANSTSEQEVINKVVDSLEKGLKDKGITVYKGSLSMKINDVLEDSLEKDVDLHLAIKGNSNDGSTYGIETYVYSSKSKIAPLASKIQTGLESIYYTKNTKKLYYCTETEKILDEVNPNKVNNGIVLKLGYLDNQDDLEWINDNAVSISNKLVEVITSYLGN